MAWFQTSGRYVEVIGKLNPLNDKGSEWEVSGTKFTVDPIYNGFVVSNLKKFKAEGRTVRAWLDSSWKLLSVRINGY